MKVKDIIKWLKEDCLSLDISGRFNGSKLNKCIYGFESFLNGSVTGTEHSVLIVLDKKEKPIKGKDLIMLLEEKNPEADIFITQKDNDFYYEIKGFETIIGYINSGTIIINRNKRMKKIDLKKRKI